MEAGSVSTPDARLYPGQKPGLITGYAALKLAVVVCYFLLLVSVISQYQYAKGARRNSCVIVAVLENSARTDRKITPTTGQNAKVLQQRRLASLKLAQSMRENVTCPPPKVPLP